MSWVVRVALLATATGLNCLAAARPVCGQEPVAYITTGNSGPYYEIASAEILLEPLETGSSRPVVTALAASHDGKYLAAAGDDHAIRIIEVESGETLEILSGHEDWIQSLSFAGDSQALFSAGNDGRVLQWNNRYPIEATEVVRLPYALRSLTVSNQQQLLAIGGFSKEIVVWDLSAGKVRFRLTCDCRDQRCVRFSPDGMHILSGGRDGELRVWRTDNGEVIADFHEHVGRVQTASFSADGWQVTSAGEDRQLIRYDLQTARVTHKQEFAQSKLMSLCLISNDVVAVAGADNAIHLYDASTNEVLADLRGHFGSVAVMTPCGDFLASGSFDTSIRIWNLETIEAGIFNFSKPVSRSLIKMDSRLKIR